MGIVDTKINRGGRYRVLSGPSKVLETGIFYALIFVGVFWILEIYMRLGIVPMGKQYLGCYLGLSLAGIYVSIPCKKGKTSRAVPWFDWLMACFSLMIGFYITAFYPTIQYVLNLETPSRIALGGIAVFLVIEALRRTVGWIMVLIVFFFLVYPPFAEYFPGMLEGKSTPVGELLNYLYLDSNAILGVPITVAATIILAFLLLGHALSGTGGAQFFMDLAILMMGRFRGGPAKMAVAASSLFGTISGAAVANVVTTGIITIPLMKKAGFRSETAAAIEATASTGGQLMPPVMGAAAFLIAELLAVPYREVVLAALIPAILFYFTVFVQIDLEAAKLKIEGISKSELPSVRNVLQVGWVAVVPLLVLIFLMFVLNFRPDKSGMIALGSLLVLALFNRQKRLTFGILHQIIMNTGRGLLEMTAICSAAGIIIGVLNVSGLGFGLSLALVNTVGQNLFLLLLLSAVVCLILGMGMPTVAVYILLAVLVAPAMTELGIIPMAAHMFIFYFGMMSMVTPPICLACFAAASIAESDPIKTGLAGMRLSIVALIVPFLFVLEPSLLMMGTPLHVAFVFLTAVCGCYFLGAGLTGYFIHPMTASGRVFAVIGGCGLLVPAGIGYNLGWITDIAGFLIILGLFARQYRSKPSNIMNENVHLSEGQI